MTILIGILCKDGVVIGSDSAATSVASDGYPTVEQQTKKIEILNNVIATSTGSAGLGQRFYQVVTDYWVQNNIENESISTISVDLSRNTINNFKSSYIECNGFGALLAYFHQGKFQLCEFDQNSFQPEYKFEHSWFVAMGSGQFLADPFLGFLRRIFWEKSMPDLQEGIFAAQFTLQHTIALNPGGINGPTQIAILKNDNNGQIIPSFLSDDELREHQDNIDSLEAHIRNYKSKMQGNTNKVIPQLSNPLSNKNTNSIGKFFKNLLKK